MLRHRPALSATCAAGLINAGGCQGHPRLLYKSLGRVLTTDRRGKYEDWPALTMTLLPAEEGLRVVTAMSLSPARSNAFRSAASVSPACKM